MSRSLPFDRRQTLPMVAVRGPDLARPRRIRERRPSDLSRPVSIYDAPRRARRTRRYRWFLVGVVLGVLAMAIARRLWLTWTVGG